MARRLSMQGAASDRHAIAAASVFACIAPGGPEIMMGRS
jgi:hypothetical protein